jgi:hypothetical protein
MFTIQILERNTGKPANYQRVGIIFNGWTRGLTQDKRTDENGEVHFSEDNGNGTIYVNGTAVYEGEIFGHKKNYI